jgi:hypothetical protein
MSISDGVTTNGTAPAQPVDDPDAIRAEIERTRAELAGTVDALHSKLDVKAQARARIAHLRDAATTESGRPRPVVLAGTAGTLVLVAGLVWWKRR